MIIYVAFLKLVHQALDFLLSFCKLVRLRPHRY